MEARRTIISEKILLSDYRMHKLLTNDSTKSQIVRFLIVGGFTTLLNYAIFAALFFLGLNYLVASATGYVTGFLIGFILFRQFTFRSESSWKKQLPMQVVVYGISLLLNLGTLWVLAEAIGLSPLLANLAAIGVSTVTNFLGMKFLVFVK